MFYPAKYYFLIFCFFIINITGFSQVKTTTENQRPKIGLVLSGGGAKGIAHIGILKAMEKEGIRPDFITGTSMGSIIGGLYALGYSANQLDSIIRSVNWDLVLSNNIPLENIAYEEKEYYNRYLIEFPFEKGKLKLPSGMIQGQILSELLSRFTWPANKYDSFDEFPIPFRCIATDVSTGQPIVFSEGSLAQAIRSSMAIPTAFTAVDLDSTLVVDGGVVNNFPVDEVLKMGADVVIGVNVGDGLIPAKELGGMTDILFQVSMIPSLTRMEDQIESCDIYIKPDLKGNGTASFGNYEAILDLGDIAGEEERPEFKALADKLNLPPQQIKPLSTNKETYHIDQIVIKGNKLVNKKLILSKLQVEEGDDVLPENIEEGIRTIYGTNNFTKVTYELDKTGSEKYILTVKLDEKKPIVVKGSFHYDNTFSAGIVLNFTIRNLLGKSSRTIVAGDISKNPKFRFDYLKYIGQSEKIALNFRYQYLNEQIPTYTDGELKDIDISYENNFSLGLITAQSLRQSFYIGGTFQLNKQKSKFQNIIPEGIKYGTFNFLKAEIIYQANTLNDRNYPTSGRELVLLSQIYLANQYKIVYNKGVDTVFLPIEIDGVTFPLPITEDKFNELIVSPLIPSIYGTLQLDYKQFIKVKKKFQIIPSVSAGITLSTDSEALFYTYRIGGYQRVKYTDNPFYGLNFAEVDYENFLMGGLFFQNIILKNVYLKYGANFLLPYGHIPLNDLDSFSSSTLFDDNSLIGYGAKLTYKSIIGPISFGMSRNTRDSYFRYYFAIGFSFNYSD